MKVEIVNGKGKEKNLVITIPMSENPQPSSKGTTRLVASSGGFAVTPLEVQGQPVKVNVVATIPNKQV